MPFLVFCGILHPSSTVRVQWDLYILLLLSTVCILTPYMICFDVVVDRVSFLGVCSSHTLNSYLYCALFRTHATCKSCPRPHHHVCNSSHSAPISTMH